MALVLTIGGNDHTAELIHPSLKVNQTNDGLNSTCSFDLADTEVVRKDVWTVEHTRVEDGDVITGHVAFSEPKVEVSVVDGATVYFAGILSRINIIPMGVIDVRGTLEAETQILKCECHDFSALLEESVIDSLEEYVNTTDEAVIDDIFGKYVVGIDFATHVDGGVFTFKSISFENITVRQAMDLIVARTGYVWYMDYSKKLHYSEAEANAPAWHLSDVPDDANSFSYLDPIKRETDATNLVNMVFIVGSIGGTWFTDDDSRTKYGDHKAIIRDARLSVDESIEARADALLAKFANPEVIYTVKTYKDDLRAGMHVRLVCAYYDVDEELLINKLKVTFPDDGAPIYELTLGGLESSIGSAARRLELDPTYPLITPGQLPAGARGWAHNLTFSALDHETVEWTGGTITTASGQEYTIVAGDTDDPGAMAADKIYYVYLDLAISGTDLRITDDPTATVGTFGRIVLAGCWTGEPGPDPPATKAGFQVFMGGLGSVLILNADNIVAGTIVADLIAANTITATQVAVHTLTGTEMGFITLSANTIIRTAASPAVRIEMGANFLAGYSDAVTKQFYLDAATGKAYAGGGVVVLDTDGVAIDFGNDLKNRLTFLDGVDEKGTLWGYIAAGDHFLRARAGPCDVGKNAILELLAEDKDGIATYIEINSRGAAGENIHLATAAGGSAVIVYPTYAKLFDDLRVMGGLYVGGDVDPDADDIWVENDIRVDGGIYVGGLGVDPPIGNLYVAIDARIGGGLYVGALDVDPGADDIWVTENVRIGKGLYVGDAALLTDADDNDIWCEGEISTDGGTRRWGLGAYFGGAPVATGWVRITINNVQYRVLAATEP